VRILQRIPLPRSGAPRRRDAAAWLALLRAESLPLQLPGGAAAAALPLFGAAAVPAGAGGPDAGTPADAVFFAGGPVWALDWCPWAGGAEPDVQHLAVRPRPAGTRAPL